MSAELPVVNCEGCGVCCLHMGYPAFNLPTKELIRVHDGQPHVLESLGPAAEADLSRWSEMPSHLRQQILDAIGNYRPPENGELDSACIWLDIPSGRCQNHIHRPQVCRDFEIGCQSCLDWRSFYEIS